MLTAVAAASLETIRASPTYIPNIPASMIINQQAPVALALKSGDAPAIGLFISTALIFVPGAERAWRVNPSLALLG
jgi:hypothetical protein